MILSSKQIKKHEFHVNSVLECWLCNFIVGYLHEMNFSTTNLLKLPLLIHEFRGFVLIHTTEHNRDNGVIYGELMSQHKLE